VITIDEAKKLARELEGRDGVSHVQVLEAAAHAAGFRDWDTFSGTREKSGEDPVGRQQVIPILRMFDAALAREFYCDFLGFDWRWQHQFEPDLPVYAEVGRAGSVLHLSEHHGDATPGGAAMIVVPDLREYQAQLLARRHRNARPGVAEDPWGLTMTITDPFGNRLVFWQRS
jgi:catechol 2,3-dioxygenase-like lactoylglutathione lyase family enzyme